VDEVFAIGPAAFNVNALTQFACDDNPSNPWISLNGRPVQAPRPDRRLELLFVQGVRPSESPSGCAASPPGSVHS
jgi:hypothetical protein